MKRFFTMLTVTLLLSATTIPARAGSLEELQKQVDELNSQMKALEEKEKTKPAPETPESESYLKRTWDRTPLPR